MTKIGRSVNLLPVLKTVIKIFSPEKAIIRLTMVRYWEQDEKKSKYIADLSFYFYGRAYHRTIHTNSKYTDLGLARLAGKFGREVVTNCC